MRDQLLKEVTYHTSRAGGPGGQHVNKTESRVELHWDPSASSALTEQQRERILQRLSGRLTPTGILIIGSQQSRSQHRNRERVTERFLRLIEWALRPGKKRIPTKPGKGAREKRLKDKKHRSEIKKLRRNKGGELT